MEKRWKKGKCVLDIILRSIFYNQNIEIKFGSRNTKLFSIKLAFQILLNHSIPMLDSKVMIESLELHNHIKFCENVNLTSRSKVLLLSFLCLYKKFQAFFCNHPSKWYASDKKKCANTAFQYYFFTRRINMLSNSFSELLQIWIFIQNVWYISTF